MKSVYELRRKVPRVRRKTKNAGKNIRLGERDYGMLRFILEMKSCNSEQMWERFFRFCKLNCVR
jgi:hypothetical protein